MVEFRRKGCCACSGRTVRAYVLLVLLVLGTAGGAALGWYLRRLWVINVKPTVKSLEWLDRMSQYLVLPAVLIMRAAQALAVPLLLASLVSGLGGSGPRAARRLTLTALLYYLLTSLLAVAQGLAFIMVIRPGADLTPPPATPAPAAHNTQVDALIDMLRNIFTDNLVTSTFEMSQTYVVEVKRNVGNATIPIDSTAVRSVKGLNLMGLTALGVAVGIALAHARHYQNSALYALTDSIFDVIMRLVRGLMWLYPVLAFFLVTSSILRLEGDEPEVVVYKMRYFILTVLLGLFTHSVVVLPLLYLMVTKRNPLRHLARCATPLFTALATGSSPATMPVTMECLRRQRLQYSVVRLMVPLGTAMNMDGFALYEVMAAIFLASLRGLPLPPTRIFILALTAIALSLGASSAGNRAVLLAVLFRSLGVPASDIRILVPCDWLMSRLRTVTNVWGDCVGAGVLERVCGDDLRAGQIAAPTCCHPSHLADLPLEEGPTLTHFSRTPSSPRDWTVRLENETGDTMVVSKV